MDLSTTYMGLQLKNPLVASASPLSESIDNIKRLEDAGVAAVVKHSLFEEQIKREAYELNRHLAQGTDSVAESLTYFPEPAKFVLGPEEYLDHIRQVKKAVGIPSKVFDRKIFVFVVYVIDRLKNFWLLVKFRIRFLE